LVEPEVNEIVIINSETVAVADFTRTGANGVKVQELVGEGQGSKRFNLRMYTVAKGGHTNVDQHEYEHQLYVLKGRGVLKKKGGDVFMRTGDAVFIPANSQHQFVNEYDEPLIYLMFNIF
jgi:quercetin dioxygenase-like cupin family protein